MFPVPRESVKSGTLEDSLEKINFEKELENTISEPVLVAPKLAERPMITDINQTRISPRVESRNHKINDVKSSPEKPRPERSTSKLSNHSMNSVAKTNGEEILETVSDQKSKVPPQKPERVSSKNVNRKID